MKGNRAALVVGLATLVIAAASFVLIQKVYEGGQFEDGYTVFGKFDSSQGLFPQSGVQTAGIRVGKILKMELAPPVPGQKPKAKVYIQIDKGMKLYENAEVHKKSASLLGEFYLEIVPGSPVNLEGEPQKELKDGDEIKIVLEVVSISEVTNQISQTIPILREILQDVNKLTSGPITQIAKNLNSSIEQNADVLKSLLQRVDNIAEDIEGITSSEAGDIRASIDNIRDITEGIKRLVATGEGRVTEAGDKISTTIDRVQSSVEKLEQSLKHIEKITGGVAKGEGTVGRLLTDDTIAENIEQVTDDVGTFVGGVARLQTVVGLRTEYNFLARTFKNYLSITLAPRPDKYYLIQLVDDPRGFRRTRTSLTQSSSAPPESTTTVETSEALRFTFMFAKRWGSVTGRFGILESTGGAGMDLHLMEDRLVLSVDVFDTRSNVYPRVRARGSVAIYKDILWVVAGADDVLNTDRTTAGGGAFLDAFLGAHLQFNDEDLKTLLLFGGNSVGSAAGSK